MFCHCIMIEAWARGVAWPSWRPVSSLDFWDMLSGAETQGPGKGGWDSLGMLVGREAKGGNRPRGGHVSQELDLAKHFEKQFLIVNVFMKGQATWCSPGAHSQFKPRLGVWGMLD